MTGRAPLILVVEDDAGVREFIAEVLEERGYEVITAADGLEGLVKLELRHPSLMLLDLMMPNVEGDRVLAEIRSDPRLANVPVLVVSGREDAHRVFDPLVGRENVVRKPFDPDALARRVAELVGPAPSEEDE